MGKIQNVTGIMSIFFIALLVVTFIIRPLDLLEKDIEAAYHANEGFIWIVGISIGSMLSVLTYINGVYQQELKKCANQALEKNTIIQQQNVEIIKGNKAYILEMNKLSELIHRNFSQDNELLRKFNELSLKFERLSDRMEKLEKEIKNGRNGGQKT